MAEREDTIAAIATAMGEASIAVIRVSGVDAIAIVDRIFVGGEKLMNCASHTIHYGKIMSLDHQDSLDEVLVSVMRAPRTYTREDVVEISTHGGWQAVTKVFEEVIRAGARLAEPGEFTKRAFLHGRIDLSQAEGVMSLIASQTNRARQAALSQVAGSLRRQVEAIRQAMLEAMARIEVTIDYPEHDDEQATTAFVVDVVTNLMQLVDSLLRQALHGRILRDGVRLAIIGRPNVGKSSLLNALVKADRAIVTDIPGTTRDVIEERIDLFGVPFTIVDTAGIRETDDVVERIGVQRSRAMVDQADLILVVLDGHRTLESHDEDLLAMLKDRSGMVLINKEDLGVTIDVDRVKALANTDRILMHSTFSSERLHELEKALYDCVFQVNEPMQATFLATPRHILLMEEALARLDDVIFAANEGQTLDLLAVDLMQAWSLLGEVIGETPREDLLDQIFSQFCLGK